MVCLSDVFPQTRGLVLTKKPGSAYIWHKRRAQTTLGEANENTGLHQKEIGPEPELRPSQSHKLLGLAEEFLYSLTHPPGDAIDGGLRQSPRRFNGRFIDVITEGAGPAAGECLFTGTSPGQKRGSCHGKDNKSRKLTMSPIPYMPLSLLLYSFQVFHHHRSSCCFPCIPSLLTVASVSGSPSVSSYSLNPGQSLTRRVMF